MSEVRIKPAAGGETPHFHRDERGVLVRCYHKSRAVLSQPGFWLGTTLSFPLEHVLWEKVWPFKLLLPFLGLD